MAKQARDDNVRAEPQKCRPHVVILGAGASAAAFPQGDAGGNKLPVMRDLIKVLRLDDVLRDVELESDSRNFEDVYSELKSTGKRPEVITQLEDRVYGYFSALQIQDQPTIYDYLLLSLRKKDAVATFNWDPLLAQAYTRCHRFTQDLPNLLFLHGNVGMGFCEACNVMGPISSPCPGCRGQLQKMRLLYPIKEKNYEQDPVIFGQWQAVEHFLSQAFAVTIFGYGAPKSDVVAVRLFKEAWGDVQDRNLEQFEIIDIRDEDDLVHTWEDFIHTHHYEVRASYFDSQIAAFPRRSVEALFGTLFEVRWLTPHKIPLGLSWKELRSQITPLLQHEA